MGYIGKGEYSGFLDTGSEFTWISGAPKHLQGTLIRVGTSQDQVINGILVKVWITVGPLDLQGTQWSFP